MVGGKLARGSAALPAGYGCRDCATAIPSPRPSPETSCPQSRIRNPMPRPRAVVFDMDGLMFNTEEVYTLVGTELMRRRGREFPDGLKDAMMGLTPRAAFEEMIRWHDLDDGWEELMVESNEIFAKHVFKRLKGLGFVVISTMKCPFDALSEDKKTLLLTGLGRQTRSTLQKAKVMATISKITEKDSVIVMNKDTSKQNIGGTPIIGKGELDGLEDPDEVITLVKERKK